MQNLSFCILKYFKEETLFNKFSLKITVLLGLATLLNKEISKNNSISLFQKDKKVNLSEMEYFFADLWKYSPNYSMNSTRFRT